jgi:CubicO group peptidase (beta-lactamase class C family)
MRRILFAVVLLSVVASGVSRTDRVSAQATPYFPALSDWQRRTPDQVGMDPAKIDAAIKYAVANENPSFKDLALDQATTFGAREPFDTIIGPLKERGALNGLIVKNGYIVADWGETSRVDVTHSVTKTFLTTVAGLAVQKGLIRSVDDFPRAYMPAGVDLFEAPKNRAIKWDHLLRQTSDWQGTLWGKPDWADRPVGETPDDWAKRKLYEPGTHFKYNDVRVNVMALAALQVWRRSLPDVLREEVMEPIGASSTWRWYGYENSWVEVDGKKVQSVSGGGHWGGGMFIDSYDMARFGYLFLRNGKWKDRSLVSEKWIQMARTPGSDNDTYGYANWYLNTGKKPLPSAPETAVRFVGNGSNIIYIDWENDIVAVVRWIRGGPALDNMLGKLTQSVKKTTTSTSAPGAK